MGQKEVQVNGWSNVQQLTIDSYLGADYVGQFTMSHTRKD